MAQVKTQFWKGFNSQVIDLVKSLGFQEIGESLTMEANSNGYFHYVLKMNDSSNLAVWVLDDSNLVHKLEIFLGFWDIENKMFIPFKQLDSIRHHKSQVFDTIKFSQELTQALDSIQKMDWNEKIEQFQQDIIAERVFCDRYRQVMTRERESAIKPNEIKSLLEDTKLNAIYSILLVFLKGIDPQNLQRVQPVKNGRKYLDLYRIICNDIIG